MDNLLDIFRIPYFFENTQPINGIYEPFMCNLFLHENSSSVTLYTHLSTIDFTDLYVVVFNNLISQMCMTGKTNGVITSVIFRNIGVVPRLWPRLWESPSMEVSPSKSQYVFYMDSSHYDDLFEFLKRHETKFK